MTWMLSRVVLTSNGELRILSRTWWLVQESIISVLLGRNSLAAKSLNNMDGGGVDDDDVDDDDDDDGEEKEELHMQRKQLK